MIFNGKIYGFPLKLSQQNQSIEHPEVPRFDSKSPGPDQKKGVVVKGWNLPWDVTWRSNDTQGHHRVHMEVS